MKSIDVRDLACPGPVLTLRKLWSEGERVLEMHVKDALARSNVTRFAESQGARVQSSEGKGGGYLVRIDGADGRAEPATTEVTERPGAAPAGGALVVQLDGTTMGEGDPELGALLMRSFVKTLSELDPLPARLVCYNGAVREACEGGVLVGDLRQLEERGVELLVCGTCLNFFELADKLAVGRVTDMLEIVQVLAGAGRVLRP